MSLLENPIFLTQRRLVHRAGVVAVVLFALVLGLSFVAGLVAYNAGGSNIHFESPEDAAKSFYGWALGMEIIVLPLFGTVRVVRALAEDRKNGLWDANRLTPLSPGQLVVGYWLGPALREYYAGLVLALCGLLIVGIGGLPLTFWLGTQVLVLAATLLLSLCGLLLVVASQRPEGYGALLLPLVLIVPYSMAASRLLLMNFLLPTYAIVGLFQGEVPAHGESYQSVNFFGGEMPPFVFTLVLQVVVGVFLWRAATRKAANPFGPLLPRWEAVIFFAVLLAAQHGLIWGLWRGNYPILDVSAADYSRFDNDAIMGMVFAGTMVAGLVLLLISSLPPERVRLAALRAGRGGLRLALARSALPQALIYTLLAGSFMYLHFTQAELSDVNRWAIATGNLLVFWVICTLLMEYCRLRFPHGTIGFIGLGMFILCILPMVLGAVVSRGEWADFSLLAPGELALVTESAPEFKLVAPELMVITCIHLTLAVGLGLLWARSWKVTFRHMGLGGLPSQAKPATSVG